MENQKDIKKDLLEAEVKHLTYITSKLETKIKTIQTINNILLTIIGIFIVWFLFN